MHPTQDPRALAIVREARHQFVSVGYAATRIEPIAREASVSTATLYMFFESKAALFEAVVKDAAQDFGKRMEAVKSEGPPSRQKLTQFMISYAEFLADPFVRKMFRLIISERRRFEGVVADFFDEGRGNIAQNLIDMFDQMNAQGLTRMEKSSWAVSQLLGMVEHPIMLLPLAMGKDPVLNRTPAAIAEDAVQTFWARYGV